MNKKLLCNKFLFISQIFILISLFILLIALVQTFYLDKTAFKTDEFTTKNNQLNLHYIKKLEKSDYAYKTLIALKGNTRIDFSKPCEYELIIDKKDDQVIKFSGEIKEASRALFTNKYYYHSTPFYIDQADSYQFTLNLNCTANSQVQVVQLILKKNLGQIPKTLFFLALALLMISNFIFVYSRFCLRKMTPPKKTKKK